MKSANPARNSVVRRKTRSHRPSALGARPSLIRAMVRQLQAYVPGEQPQIRGLIKLNTNENPYPPSPRVLAAVKGARKLRLVLLVPLELDLIPHDRHLYQMESLGSGS